MDFLPRARTLPALRAAADWCRGCRLYASEARRAARAALVRDLSVAGEMARGT